MSAIKGRPGPMSKSAQRRAQRLFVDRLPELAQRAVELALMVDAACLVACLDRAWPVQRPEATRQGDRP